MQDNPMKLEELSIDELIRIAEQDMITAPHYLKENVMERSQSVQVQLPMKLEVHTRQVSKKMQMFYYTMKVSAAMVCTLILLLLVPNIKLNIDQGYQEAKRPIEEKRTEVTETFMEKRSNFRESIDTLKANFMQSINGGNDNEQL